MFNATELFKDDVRADLEDDTEYKFGRIKRLKGEFRTAHPDVEILDFGVGEHDGVAPEPVRERFKEAIDDPGCRGYADNGVLEFQQAAARYINRELGLDLPTDEGAAKFIIHGIGSKGILSRLPTAFINPGDVTIMTVPGYPVLGKHTKYLGGQVVNLPLTEENGFLPDLEKLDSNDPRSLDEGIKRIEAEKGKVKLFCVNYPNNPTGANATPEFWPRLVEMGHKYNFVVVQDAAYSGLEFDGRRSNSLLQTKEGIECGIGIYSMSKMTNMIGYRLAFAVGNPDLIKAYANVKDNSDSGQFIATQQAAIIALDDPGFTLKIKKKYDRRLHNLVQVLNKHGFNTKMPAGTFFLYTKAPTGTKDGKRFENADEVMQHMLSEEGVSVVPWDDAGHYIRFSATFDSGDPYSLEGSPDKDQKVFGALDERLERLQLRFD